MIIRRLFLLVVFAGTVLAQANPDWHRPFPTFKIAGPLYYVGTADLAVYLVNTPRGNILINSDFEEDLPLIRQRIEQLGFKYSDTKIVLISHAHADHDAGTSLLKKETHARLMVMDADVSEVESAEPGHPGASVDRILHDGDTVELGNVKLTARLTPGHTRGCTTWIMQVQDGGRTLNVVIVGSATVSSGAVLEGNKNYPQIAQDYLKTFAVLKSLSCDVFLGAHGHYFDLKAKYERMKAGDPNPFIDPDGYKAYVAEREAAFQEEWKRQRQQLHEDRTP
jgi:metallo-beta-lactamase class B